MERLDHAYLEDHEVEEEEYSVDNHSQDHLKPFDDRLCVFQGKSQVLALLVDLQHNRDNSD